MNFFSLKLLYIREFKVKVIGTTLSYLIQQTNDRLTLRYKRKMKRHRMKDGTAGALPLTSTANESNRFPTLSPTNSSSITPNIFNTVQGTSMNPMPQTATRNPSTAATATKKTTPSLASLLTSNNPATSNGTSQFNTTPLDLYNVGDISPTKQTKASKAAATKAAAAAANKGAEPARRGPAAGSTGAKRLVVNKQNSLRLCSIDLFELLEHQRKILRLLLQQCLIFKVKRIQDQ